MWSENFVIEKVRNSLISGETFERFFCDSIILFVRGSETFHLSSYIIESGKNAMRYDVNALLKITNL